MDNYGLILKQLRSLNGYSLKMAAAKIEKSVGWLSEVENCRGLSRLKPTEFERIVTIFNGDHYKKQFKTWVAIEKTKEKADRSLDGAVLKHIRNKKELLLEKASSLIGISKHYLSNLENGRKPIKLEMRNRIMQAYGYAPSSFRNLSCDEIRSKAVPVRYKITILLNQLDEVELYSVFEHVINLNSKQEENQNGKGN